MYLNYFFIIHRGEHQVGVPEWLSGMTRNHVGSARAGSNPAAHVLFCNFIFVLCDGSKARARILLTFYLQFYFSSV